MRPSGRLGDLETDIHIGNRVVVGRGCGYLGPQPDREATVDTDAGIGVRLLPSAELTLQIVKLLTHVDQRLHRLR